eukprot:1161670-Pelagomonas_calceolata.AAC.17
MVVVASPHQKGWLWPGAQQQGPWLAWQWGRASAAATSAAAEREELLDPRARKEVDRAVDRAVAAVVAAGAALHCAPNQEDPTGLCMCLAVTEVQLLPQELMQRAPPHHHYEFVLSG